MVASVMRKFFFSRNHFLERGYFSMGGGGRGASFLSGVPHGCASVLMGGGFEKKNEIWGGAPLMPPPTMGNPGGSLTTLQVVQRERLIEF